MSNKRVKCLMLPFRDYAVVADTATILDAIRILRQRTIELAPGHQPPRAILVADASSQVIGQVEYLDILKALEPKYNLMGNLDTLSKAGLSNEIMDTLAANLNLLQGDLEESVQRIRGVSIRTIMHPLTESIDEEATLSEAIHRFVLCQTNRVLVTRNKDAIGVLRLADLFDIIAEKIDPKGM